MKLILSSFLLISIPAFAGGAFTTVITPKNASQLGFEIESYKEKNKLIFNLFAPVIFSNTSCTAGFIQTCTYSNKDRSVNTCSGVEINSSEPPPELRLSLPLEVKLDLSLIHISEPTRPY